MISKVAEISAQFCQAGQCFLFFVFFLFFVLRCHGFFFPGADDRNTLDIHLSSHRRTGNRTHQHETKETGEIILLLDSGIDPTGQRPSVPPLLIFNASR